jgi:hypothetical protein
MTERMQAYRDRMREKGLVQVRVWVDKQDEEFVKFMAKFCREEGKKKPPKKRFGRPASEYQIRLSQEIAEANSVPEPKHLYGHHISLGAWMRGHGGR